MCILIRYNYAIIAKKQLYNYEKVVGQLEK